jgi:hypothetical protein
MAQAQLFKQLEDTFLRCKISAITSSILFPFEAISNFSKGSIFLYIGDVSHM